MSNFTVQVPGENRADELIEAARSGFALKIEKPHEEAPPLKLEIADATRPADANINKTPDMSYEEAIALQRAGKLTRPVLTEQGWVTLNRASMKSGSRVE